MRQRYFFFLGRTPALSLAELRAVVAPEVVTEVTSQFACVELESDQDAIAIFELLGGSLKVMKEVGKFALLSDEQLVEYLAAFLADQPRPTFAIAEFGRVNHPRVELSDVKQKLKARGVASRFIDGERDGLSASILLHHKVIEVNVIDVDQETTYFVQTIGVQNIDEWTKRDRSKPYADRKKGMLPPKLARMMVNLALPSYFAASTEMPRIFDPFCGSGSILIEAAMRNCSVAGSDIDKDAVAGSKANMAWLQVAYNRKFNTKVLLADATTIKPEQIDRVQAIITEPFLGKQTPTQDQLPNIFKGLEKMYFGAFKNWRHLLDQNSPIVIIFPYIEVGKQVFSLEGMIDKLRALGYTATSQPILYARPDAIVQRQIWQLRYKTEE